MCSTSSINGIGLFRNQHQLNAAAVSSTHPSLSAFKHHQHQHQHLVTRSLSPSSSFNHHEPPPHLLLSLSPMSPPPPPLPPSPPTFSLSLKSIGLGYAIAIALGFLVLLSALLLSSYLCCRTRRRNRRHLPTTTAASPSSGVIVPRIIFVAEEGESDDQNRGGSGSSPIGVDRAVINSYPKFQFYKNNLEHSTEGTNNSMCSICLCDYKEGEMLRMMPDCKHYFHLCCLDAWLKLNGSCPVCRNSPLPTPISTPLAEVVPLSQYPDNRRRSTVVSSS